MTIDLSNRTLTIERTFKAPRKLVWDAWTQPEHLANWWGRGAPVNIVEHNFKEDGKWKFTMQMPDGSEFISEGIYSEIVEHEKIVTSAEFRPMTEGVILTVLLKDDGDDTHMTFSVLHPTQEYAQQQEKMGFFNGWGSVFEVMASYLTSTQ